MSLIKTLICESADMQIDRIHSTECVGTSKKDSLEMSYTMLVKKLGEPELHPSGSDVRVEWCFKASIPDEQDFVFSVYNDPRYYNHVPPHEMDSWNIGCKTSYQATLIKMFIKR